VPPICLKLQKLLKLVAANDWRRQRGGRGGEWKSCHVAGGGGATQEGKQGGVPRDGVVTRAWPPHRSLFRTAPPKWLQQFLQSSSSAALCHSSLPPSLTSPESGFFPISPSLCVSWSFLADIFALAGHAEGEAACVFLPLLATLSSQAPFHNLLYNFTSSCMILLIDF
jgi:hypothetical protein